MTNGVRCCWASLLCFLGHSQVLACFMLPKTYEGTISQNDHEAVILYHAGREELVLRINYQITGETMPNQFAWVITVPNEPDHYALADKKLFEEMFELSKKLTPEARLKKKYKFGGGGGSFGVEGVELGKHVTVGPYDIQPVRGVGQNALQGLNAWLKENQFPTEEPEHLKYFVKNNFTFLCVKITARQEQDSVDPQGTLPPLHLSLESPRPYFPLRFSSRQGVFNINLHVLMPRRFDYVASHRVLNQINWSNERYTRNYRLAKKKMPEPLKALMTKSKLDIQQDVWFYNNIRGRQVNKNNAIADWKTDVFFNGVPERYGASGPLLSPRNLANAKLDTLRAPGSGSPNATR